MQAYLPALLWIAGVLHFGLLLASFSVPRALDWRACNVGRALAA